LACSDPRVSVTRIALLGLAVAFFSASQDIVVDAWRREAFQEHDLGLANAINIGAYRVAMLCSGGGALILAGRSGWRYAYLIMAALMALGSLGTLLAWSTDAQAHPPRTLRDAVERPLRQLLMRPAIGEILAFCLLYKIGDQLADTMSAPFLLRGMGFTLTQIGATTKTVGMVSLVLGGLLGGVLMKKLSLKRALLLFGLCQCGSILAFWALSRLGPLLSVLTGALALENLCWGMGTAAFATFLMLLCDRRYTATQYALLTSILAFTRGLLSTPAGWFQAHFGWSGYFLGCALVAIPGLLLLSRFDRWGIEEDNA
jgi:PAT family beta-lactamase induction signal transducer AmpG